MAIDPALVADCPYGPGGLLIDDVLRIDEKESLVVARMPTHDELPLTREQRAHPVFHPRHVSGGLMVHMTGMVAYVHAYHLLGLRHADGWVGWGARIRSARFKALAKPGEPMELACKATTVRRSTSTILATYDFTFTQAGTLIYEGDQTALWQRITETTPPEGTPL